MGLEYGVSLAEVVLDGSDGQQASCVDTGGNSGLSDGRVVFSVLVLVRLLLVGRRAATEWTCFGSVLFALGCHSLWRFLLFRAGVFGVGSCRLVCSRCGKNGRTIATESHQSRT